MSEETTLPKPVIYCGVCSLPPEYCESAREAVFSRSAAAKHGLPLRRRPKRAEKDAQKKAAKAATAEARAAETRASSKILIKRIERNKRKYVTAVQGLEAFGLDIKKVAKDFGKKFATGSSVTKIPGGGEEITVQGDLSEEILEFLIDKYEGVPEDNVEMIEDKKKKKTEGV
ncbi:hypothetical protein P3342_010831 [Pyrenophora teres f. teres]|nr:hypothetical protein P3342_010831 [Pyrenophora teres f. teres]